MRLSLSLRQIQICTICEQSVCDHAASCPHLLAEALADKRLNIRCPCCDESGCCVDLNTSDFYECRKCNTQFTHSALYDDGKQEPIILIDWNHDKAIACIQLPYKGNGQFKIDIEAAKIDRIIKHARRRARKKKNAKSEDL